MTILTREYAFAWGTASPSRYYKLETHYKKSKRLNRSNRIVAKVNCMAQRHTIVLDNGKLSFPDHPEGFEDISTLLVLNPDLRCRCQEVKQLWATVPKCGNLGQFKNLVWGNTHGDDVVYDNSIEWGWMHATFVRYDLTASRVASIIPKSLRTIFEENWQLADSRRLIKEKIPAQDKRPLSQRYSRSNMEATLVTRLQAIHHRYLCDDSCGKHGRSCEAPISPRGFPIRDFLVACSETPWRLPALKAGFLPQIWNLEDKERGWFVGYTKGNLARAYYSRKQNIITYELSDGRYVFTKTSAEFNG